MCKLQLLVFSFYREEPEIKKLLDPLHSCSITRSWESIQIDCLDLKHLESLKALLIYLEPPFALLGLGRQIILRAPGLIKYSHPIEVCFKK
ncbi:hypothetical protein [Prochlorococcus sp. MIT 1307]|uniref:hypothetical protein n=1 Tax=Prochlorococcus sp. MIT 1307 TaxID=3096219 RepID=UPI002A75609B|nr:hypothetical protein [Prochlorococcus sp. MIT 1307]